MMASYIHHYRCPKCGQEWTQDTSKAIGLAPHQFCPDTQCKSLEAQRPHATVEMIDTTADRLADEIDQAEVKAMDSLARYKFQMFGYWAGIWVHLNKIEGKRRPSPFKGLVMHGRKMNAAKDHAEF